MPDPNELMRLAIDTARQGIAGGQTPFGCAIAVGDQVVATAHNTVLADTNITAHAEINALRAACQSLGDVHLRGAIVASTCEPCPMCAAALHWAQVTHIYFGATIADATTSGFNELNLSAATVLRKGGSKVKLTGDLLTKECRDLFRQWQAQEGSRTY